MNEYQLKLYNDLTSLVQLNTSFYKVRHTLNNSFFDVFAYRLASYTDFLTDSALECRGIMFEVTEEGSPIRLASLPMEKFFNVNENPLTMNLNFTQVDHFELKVDGSLISSFTNDNELYLKSKTSIKSDVAIAAMDFLRLPENEKFYDEIKQLDDAGYTVNFEWLSPDNQIVIAYDEPMLTVLNVRNRADGSYLTKSETPSHFSEILLRYDEHITPPDPVAFVNGIYDITSCIEGYVLVFKSGLRCKMKTNKYSSLHKIKDRINSPRRLYECVLNEGVDDLRALFFADPTALNKINTMEDYVVKLYNSLSKTVEDFFEENKDLSRKEYALLAKEKMLSKNEFDLCMYKYLRKPIDYKQYMIKRWKDFGIKDEPYPEYIEEEN